MSKSFAETALGLFRPQLPLWACEFTPRHLAVAGVDRNRSRVVARTAAPLSEKLFSASLSESNIRDAAGLRSTLTEALKSVAHKGSEMIVVIPDESSRISFVTTEKLAKDPGEQQIFLRWKLKKTVPFDLDTAQISYQILGPHQGNGAPGKNAGYDLIVAMSPRKVVEEYETLFDAIDIHAGMVIPSTIALLGLFTVPAEDALFVKAGPDCVTTTIFQNRRIKFFRRVPGLDLFDAIFPTLLYYQDKLGGDTMRQVTVCTYDSDMREAIAEVETKLGVRVQYLGPRNIDNIFKPALGAVQFSWVDSL